jgi:hypothetical protein
MVSDDDSETPPENSGEPDEQAAEQARRAAEAIDEIGADRVADLVVDALRATGTDADHPGLELTDDDSTDTDSDSAGDDPRDAESTGEE